MTDTSTSTTINTNMNTQKLEIKEIPKPEIKILRPEEVNMVIYHAGCNDGYGSAFVAYNFLKKTCPETKVEFYPAFYNSSTYPEVKGKNVLVCDFSFKKNISEKMIKEANKFLILDHHKSAMKDLEQIPAINKVFDMEHSGAYLTWKFFFGSEPVPKLISYIQDNDIWTKEMKMTHEFSAFINTVPKTFDEYGKLMDEKYLVQMIETEGSGMLKQNNTNIMEAVRHSVVKFVEIDGKYYFVVHLNSTCLVSEIGNKVFEKFPNADFSAIYHIDDYTNTTQFSLRSMNDRADVSELASKWGGGGHKCASGFKVYSIANTIPGTVYDIQKIYNLLENIYFSNVRIQETEYSVVYLNATTHKTNLGKYLLQTRYTEGKQPVQECTSIYKNKNKKALEMKSNNIQIAAIWNYDGAQDITWFTIILHSELSQFSDDKRRISTYFKEDIRDNTLVVKFTGVKTSL